MDHPDLAKFLRNCAECEPEEASSNLSVFADWLEEQTDGRCGEIRKILHRGPVDVEPLGIGYLTHPESGRRFRGYIGGGRDIWGGNSDGEIWWQSGISTTEARREFLHRMRVECLAWFYIPELPPGVPKDARFLGWTTGTALVWACCTTRIAYDRVQAPWQNHPNGKDYYAATSCHRCKRWGWGLLDHKRATKPLDLKIDARWPALEVGIVKQIVVLSSEKPRVKVNWSIRDAQAEGLIPTISTTQSEPR